MKRLLSPMLLVILCSLNHLSAQWTTSGPFGTVTYCDMNIGSTTYIGTSTGVYKTTDGGQVWLKLSTNLPAGTYVSALYFDGITMYAGLNGQLNEVYTSGDTGINWSLSNSGLIATTGYQAFCQVGNKVFLTYADGMSYTTNSGAAWTGATAPFDNTGYIYYDGYAMYALSTFGGPIAISYDTAQTWAPDTSGMGNSAHVGRLFFSYDTIYAVGDHVYFSTNHGASWTIISDASNAYFGKICFDGTSFYQSTGGNNGLQVIKNTIGDTAWTDVTGILPPGNVNDMFVTTYGVFISLNDYLYVSTNGGASWVQTNNNGLILQPVASVCADGATIYGGSNSGVYRSPGIYAPWIFEADSFSAGSIMVIYRFGAYLYAGSNDAGVYLSSDGVTWIPADSGLGTTGQNVSTFTDDGKFLYAGMGGASVYRSDSITWSVFGTGLPKGQVNDLLVNGQYIYAASTPLNPDTPCVYMSSLSLAAWSPIGNGLPLNGAVALSNFGDTLYVSLGDSGIYQSINSGSSWTSISSGLPQPITVHDLLTVGDTLFAATDSGTYEVRVDTLSSWQALNQDLGNLNVHQLSYSDSLGYLFAATDASVWQILLSPPIETGIHTLSPSPLSVQVYPNPSPTGIWQLVSNDDLAGSIVETYDIQGQLIFRSEIRNPKSDITLNVPPGIYLLRITNKDVSCTTKLVKD